MSWDGPVNPVQSEFGDDRLGPALPAVLDDISRTAMGFTRYAHRHPIIEHVIEDGPVIIKRHLERSRQDEYGDEVTYPFGEVTFYDGSCDRTVVTYTIGGPDDVLRTPGFLDGYKWHRTHDRITIESKDDFPRTLETVEANELARQIFDLLGVTVPAHYPGSLITWAIDLAACRGTKAQEIEERHLLHEPTERNWGCRDDVSVRATERKQWQAGMETAPKLEVTSMIFRTPQLREVTDFSITEGGIAEYKLAHIDFPNPEELPDKELPDPLEEFNRRIAETNTNKVWEQKGREAGLPFATQEQAERVYTILTKEVAPRIMWHLVTDEPV